MVLEKIKNFNYTSDLTIGKIALSNFHFQLENFSAKSETFFFVLLVTNETEIKMSQIQRADHNGYIIFDSQFKFDVKSDFRITVQVFYIIMKEHSKLYNISSTLIMVTELLFILQIKNIDYRDRNR